MRLPIPSSWRRADEVRPAPSPAGDFPVPREVLGEIGFLLAVHLAVALAVAAALQWFGIA